MIRRVLIGAAALLAFGCASQEFYLEQPEAPWATRSIQRVEVPPFEAMPSAWSVADTARQRVTAALSRGTVEVVERGAQATLRGAVTAYDETTTTGAPRRVQQSSSAGGLQGVSYIWEMDVTYTVRLGLVVRLIDESGTLLWTKETYGYATENSRVTLNWPGSDPVPPPALLPQQPDRSLFMRLRDQALNDAVTPLIGALTVHYGYRTLK